jgi:hypothetical protein
MKKAIFILINIINTTLFGQNVSNKTNRFIVKFKHATLNPTINQTSLVIFGVSKADALNEKFGCIAVTNLFASLKKSEFSKALEGVYVLTFKANQSVSEVVNAYLATGWFKYVEPDKLTEFSWNKN